MRLQLILLPIVSMLLLATLAIPSGRERKVRPTPSVLPPLPAASSVRDLAVRLTVREPSGTARAAEPVASGVPLAREAGVFAAGSLGLVDPATGAAVPSQLRVLSRWGGPPTDSSLPIRWILVQTVLDLEAGASRDLVLGPKRGQSDPNRAVRVRRDGTAVVVDTGAGRFRFRDGALRTDAGELTIRMDGARPDDVRVEVESDGPLLARVAVRGRFPKQGIELTSRFLFAAGSPEARLDVTLTNRGSYGFRLAPEHAYFHSVEAVLELGAPARVARLENVTSPVLPGERLTLLQTHSWVDPRDQDRNFSFDVRAEPGGRVLLSGRKARGYAEIPGGPTPVAAAVSEFWEGFPSGLSVTERELRLALWPEDGASRYRLDGGRQKTRMALLRFGPGDDTLPERLAKPLLLTPSPRYLESVRALGTAAVAGGELPPEVAAVAKRYERLQGVRYDESVADPVPGLGRSTLETFRRRAGPYGSKQSYGWLHFGDIPWACGQSSGHYDWPYGMLTAFLRTGDRRAFDLGAPMARHRRDVDQYHGRDHPVFAGGQFFEKGEFHGDAVQSPVPSHTWVGGLALYHLLTGDQLSLEALREVRRFYEGYWVEYQRRTWNADYGEVRQPGWSILGLAQIYAVTGEPETIQLARDIIQGVIDSEARCGGRGYVLAPNGNVGSAYPWQHGILLTGLSAYLDETGPDPEVTGLMARVSRWLREECLTGGRREPGGYVPLAVRRSWRPDGGEAAGHEGSDPAHGIHLVDGLARTYLATGDRRHLETARALFRDFTFYWQEPPGLPVPDGKLSPITFMPRRYPETESKIFGWIGRYGGTYLFAEREAEPGR